MYAYIARVRAKGKLYEYLQVCETVRRDGKPTRRTLGSLGRLDRLDPHKVDGLIRGLRRFADREAASPGPREAPLLATRQLGPIEVARRLWEELGLPRLLPQGQQGFSVEQVLFRLVANRLVAPQSKRALVDWQAQVEWGTEQAYSYDDVLRAMDVLHAHQPAVEEALFGQLRQLFSTPLRLVWYDLTSTYFEGDGVCEVAAYGHSRDHRRDRAQVVLGLALTQEGYPIAHHVFPGDTADVSTVAQLAQQLQQRFGLPEALVVGDRGLLCAANAQALEELGLRYVLGPTHPSAPAGGCGGGDGPGDRAGAAQRSRSALDGAGGGGGRRPAPGGGLQRLPGPARPVGAAAPAAAGARRLAPLAGPGGGRPAERAAHDHRAGHPAAGPGPGRQVL
jgi:hypothetical protein